MASRRSLTSTSSANPLALAGSSKIRRLGISAHRIFSRLFLRCLRRAPRSTGSHLYSSMTSEDSPSEDSAASHLPSCRICQMNCEESPNLPMIRPCLCSGSLAYVHIKCLNEWRATSPSAQTTCSICKFRYRTKGSSKQFIELLSNSTVISVTALICILLCIIITGVLIRLLSRHLFPSVDLPRIAADFVAVHRWWHTCYSIIRRLPRPEGYSIDALILSLQQYSFRLVCCPPVTAFMDAFLSGFLFVSYSAIVVTVIMEIRRRRVMAEPADQNQLFVVISLLATLYSQTHIK